MAHSESHLILDLNWKDAVKQAKKRVKDHPLYGKGLEFICAAPKCENYDPLVEFKHPVTKHVFSVCQYHYKVLSYEMRETGYRMATLAQAMRDLAGEHGGTLNFADIRTSVPELARK